MATSRLARILGVFFALGLAAALSACGGDSHPGDGSTPSDGSPGPGGARPFPLLVPALVPAGVSLGQPEFTTTDNGIPQARFVGRTDDGREAFVIDEQALVHGDGAAPDLGEGDSVRGRPAMIFEGPPRLISWVESSLWVTVRSDMLSLGEIRALVESMELR